VPLFSSHAPVCERLSGKNTIWSEYFTLESIPGNGMHVPFDPQVLVFVEWGFGRPVGAPISSVANDQTLICRLYGASTL
jgi:hypothetical protein